MCGRFANDAKRETLENAFGTPLPHEWARRWNIAPGTDILVIVPGMAVLLRWGLVPRWTKDPSMGSRMINARSETVFEKPSFRMPARFGRCLVPATAYYEWKGTRRNKEPYAFGFKQHSLFAMAAIRDDWMDESTGEAISSFAILTTSANETVAPIHERMPVMLGPDQWDIWLNPATPREQLEPLFEPPAAASMHAWPVTPQVGNPAHDGPDCLTPVEHHNGRQLPLL